MLRVCSQARCPLVPIYFSQSLQNRQVQTRLHQEIQQIDLR